MSNPRNTALSTGESSSLLAQGRVTKIGGIKSEKDVTEELGSREKLEADKKLEEKSTETNSKSYNPGLSKPTETKPTGPEPTESNISPSDIDKIVNAVRSKMQTTTIVLTTCMSGSLSAAISILMSFLLSKSSHPTTIGSNGTVTSDPALSPNGWSMNSSLIILTTQNKTFAYDLATISQSRPMAEFQAQFQKQLQEQFEFYMIQTNKQLETMVTSLDQISKQTDNKIGDVKSEFMQMIDGLKQSLSTLITRVDDQNITILMMVNTSKLLQINQTVLLEKLIENQDTLQNVTQKLETMKENMKEIAWKGSKAYDRCLQASTDTTSQGFSLSMILLSAAVVILIDLPIMIYVLKKFNPTTSFTTQRNGSPAVPVTLTRHARDTPIRYSTLEKLVTVIACDQTTLINCKPQIESIAGELGKAVKAEYINQEEDFSRVAFSKVMILLVDRNERDVILEDTGLLQGEKNVKMVKTMISNAVDVFVVYVGHEESAVLPGTDLYHPSLTSVRKHSILLSLSQKARVFSIRQTFFAHQTETLRQAFRKI